MELVDYALRAIGGWGDSRFRSDCGTIRAEETRGICISAIGAVLSLGGLSKPSRSA